MPVDPIHLLKSHSLKHTRQRVRVLEEIALDTVAISQPELEKKLGAEMDRVTLYRILNVYEDKGILHRIIDLNGTANYAICSASCSVENHQDEHVHFTCSNCSRIYCLDVKIPLTKMPAGFSATTTKTMSYGICAKCNKQ